MRVMKFSDLVINTEDKRCTSLTWKLNGQTKKPEYLFYWVTSLNMLKDYRCLNVELIKILKQCAKYHPVLVCALKTCAHRAMTIFFHHTFELEIALPIIRAFHSNFHNSKQDIKNLHDQLSCQWWKVITIAEIYQLSVCKLWLRETKSLWVFCFVNHMPQKSSF